MFEVLKMILDLFGKLFSPAEISSFLQQKKKRELGSDLFLLYVCLNEIVVSGESLLVLLEDLTDEMLNPKDKDRVVSPAEQRLEDIAHGIVFRITQQQVNLARLATLLERLSKELLIVDADAYRKIHPLIIGKANTLESIIEMLQEGRIPLFLPDEQMIRDAMDKCAYPYDSEDGFSSEMDDHGRNAVIKDTIREASISLPLKKRDDSTYPSYLLVWEEGTALSIKKYVKDRKPQKELSHLKEAADQLRQSLEKYFSITDILLEVGSKRFETNHFIVGLELMEAEKQGLIIQKGNKTFFLRKKPSN